MLPHPALRQLRHSSVGPPLTGVPQPPPPSIAAPFLHENSVCGMFLTLGQLPSEEGEENHRKLVSCRKLTFVFAFLFGFLFCLGLSVPGLQLLRSAVP